VVRRAVARGDHRRGGGCAAVPYGHARRARGASASAGRGDQAYSGGSRGVAAIRLGARAFLPPPRPFSEGKVTWGLTPPRPRAPAASPARGQGPSVGVTLPQPTPMPATREVGTPALAVGDAQDRDRPRVDVRRVTPASRFPARAAKHRPHNPPRNTSPSRCDNPETPTLLVRGGRAGAVTGLGRTCTCAGSLPVGGSPGEPQSTAPRNTSPALRATPKAPPPGARGTRSGAARAKRGDHAAEPHIRCSAVQDMSPEADPTHTGEAGCAHRPGR
jgi:hypothetical protein